MVISVKILELKFVPFIAAIKSVDNEKLSGTPQAASDSSDVNPSLVLPPHLAAFFDGFSSNTIYKSWRNKL